MYQIYVHDYQYEVNDESESDAVASSVTAPISSSYFLLIVAFIAIIVAFYVFCISEKPRSFSCGRNQKVDRNSDISEIFDSKSNKNHSKSDSEINQIV